MGRPRKSTQLLETSGAFRNHPDRRREDPETSGEIGDPPGHLTPSEQETWEEIVRLALPGVLTLHDRIAVELATRLLAEYRTNSQSFNAAKLGRLEAMLGRFGMTPADRSRVAGKSPSHTNPFANNGRRPATQ